VRAPHLIALVTVLLGACRAHVDLEPLPPRLTREQRMNAFEKLRPQERSTEIAVSCRGTACSTAINPMLVLGDGTEIQEPDDLLVVVPPDSETARAAARAARVRSQRTWLAVGTVLGAFAGLAMFTYEGWRSHQEFASGNADESTLGSLAYVGLGVGLGSALVGYIGHHYLQGRENAHKRRAFASYETDLASRLQICATGLRLVPCEGASSELPATPPGETPPSTLP
jgi:hypothetical protein